MFIIWINNRMFYHCEDVISLRNTLAMLARGGAAEVEIYIIGSHLTCTNGKWQEHCDCEGDAYEPKGISDASFAREELARFRSQMDVEEK
jgi:hypothetical protein